MICEQTVRKLCKDDITKIKNYEQAISDNTQVWDCHHQLELTLDGEFAHSREELKRLGMYYNRPYFELIFLTKVEHRRIHRKGKPLSPETRAKMSEAKKGANNPMYGKPAPMKGKKIAPFTEKHIAKIAEARRKYWAKYHANKEQENTND